MNVLLARTTHVAGLYKVGVGVSLIGRMRWTAAAREGREERDSISLPTSECPYPSCGSHATARARTLALPRAPAPSQPSSLTRCCVLFTPRRTSFLPFRARRRMHILVFRALPGASIVSVDERWIGVGSQQLGGDEK